MSKSTGQKMGQLLTSLKGTFKERESLAEGMLAAILSKEPLFVLGPPGTAKSMICRALCQAIGGNYFEWLMTKFTTPEELFGPLSLKGLNDDKYIRVTTDKLPEAHIAFLDEFFKASSAISNTLLTVVNERMFHNDGAKKIPLQTVFAASNEIPQAEELSALYDRMVLRYVVDSIKDDNNFLSLFDQGVDFTQIPKITLDELAQAQDEAMKLPVPAGTSAKVKELRNAMKEKGIYVSDRKWIQGGRVVRAAAYLNGHSEVQVEDLTILENVLWSDPSQIPEIRTLVRKLCNPIAETIQRHMDAANEVMLQFQKGKVKEIEAFTKVTQSKDALQALADANPTRTDVEAAVNQVGAVAKELADTLFKSRKAAKK